MLKKKYGPKYDLKWGPPGMHECVFDREGYLTRIGLYDVRYDERGFLAYVGTRVVRTDSQGNVTAIDGYFVSIPVLVDKPKAEAKAKTSFASSVEKKIDFFSHSTPVDSEEKKPEEERDLADEKDESNSFTVT